MNPLVDLTARPIIAHRGASAEAPENTMPAFELAVEQGADAIEFDIQVTADGIPVVMHDPMLERTTNRSGAVAAHTLSQLRVADAGAQFSPDHGQSFPWRDRGARIPTLAEVVDAFALPLLIELKTPRAQDAVRQVLQQHGATDRCVIAAADANATTALRDSPFLLGASRRDIVRLLLRTYFRIPVGNIHYSALSVPERHRRLPIATRGFVMAARRLGCPVHVWTVDEPTTVRALWKRGVAGIVTNVPGVMREIRDTMPRTAPP